jgi:hypothetical protein
LVFPSTFLDVQALNAGQTIAPGFYAGSTSTQLVWVQLTVQPQRVS